MTVAKTLNHFYPDLIASGGLADALRVALRGIGSNLVPLELGKGFDSRAYSLVESGPRFSQIHIASEKRLFLFDFWARGVCLASGATSSIPDVASAIDKWVSSVCTTADLAGTFSFVVVNETAGIYERGEEVEDRWRRYIEAIQFPELVSFVQAAFRRDKLRHLFPYTTHSMFCFSRCTGYPFTWDTPYVRPLENGEYEVISASGAVLGKGEADMAADLVVANLPPQCGPAVPGTADDIGSQFA